jgi:predicted nucleic acid-binding protein
LDTNVVLDWLIFSDPTVGLLATWIEDSRAGIVTRSDCREELVRVLAYPRVPASPAARERALAHYDRRAVPCAPPKPGTVCAPLPECRDRDDQKFLELARDSGACWLITKDRHLLKLARKIRVQGFCFEVLDPIESGKRLSSPSRNALS